MEQAVSILVAIRSALAEVLNRPVHAAGLVLLGALLIWLVTTSSLPYALAKTSPETALWLNPNNPTALTERAERLRRELLESIQTEPVREEGATIGRFSAPLTSQSRKAREEKRESIRAEIKKIARRIIRNDPLNATAYRLLAEVSSEPDEIRRLMLAAVARSRREAVALFWLLNDTLSKKDYENASAYADTLMRTRPQLTTYVVRFLGLMMREEKGRAIVRQELAKPAAWRASFFASLSKLAIEPRHALALMIGLKNTDHPVTEKEQQPFINALIRSKNIRLAYNTWLQLLPPDTLSKVKLLNNSGFESPLSKLPFNWQISRAVNAVSEISKAPGGGNSYHIRFGEGRVTAPKLTQTTVLAPGSYRLTAQVQGQIRGKRGMTWTIACLYGRRVQLLKSPLVFGPGATWDRLVFEFAVPQDPNCTGQQIMLSHDARSASEQFVTGELWFDDVEIVAANR